MLPSKTVLRIDQTDSGVGVYSEDGSSCHGDVVVGCDGVNCKASTRREMCRLAREDPDHFRALKLRGRAYSWTLFRLLSWPAPVEIWAQLRRHGTVLASLFWAGLLIHGIKSAGMAKESWAKILTALWFFRGAGVDLTRGDPGV